MEAQIGGKSLHFYGPVVSDLKRVGKTSIDWDLNDWKWDGDLFTAAPLNHVPSDCRSRQLFPANTAALSEINPENEKGKRELEKRRRVEVVEEKELHDEAGFLNLKLGGPVVMEESEEEKSGKKRKFGVASSNRAVCQVQDCQADLGNAKDYHRRHKVCTMHSKATKALVANVMQRFCQQCSRFHVLQEFDEGKRSCRRRLAGHNRRRRKAHPESIVSGSSMNDKHANRSDQTKDHDLLSHLLRNLASLAGTSNISRLLSASQDLQPAQTSVGTVEEDHAARPIEQCATVATSNITQKRICTDDRQGGNLQSSHASQSTVLYPANDGVLGRQNAMESRVGRIQLNNIDLNNAYDDSQDCIENLGIYSSPVNPSNQPLGRPSWVHQDFSKSSPSQTSGNSSSTPTQSLSSSSGEAQFRTDRIVFKLFGKDPNDFPFALRKQILDWLSHSPTEIESYIRPGCIILTIYLRMEKPIWKELCRNLTFSLRRLLDASNDSFWKRGWVYITVRHHVAFLYNGQVILDTPLPLGSHKMCSILSIKPIAVSASDSVQFTVKGFNISQSSARLLCALEGKYMVQRSCSDMVGGADVSVEHGVIQSLSFPCSIPDVTGRGFIEVEDQAFTSTFFPFIVAEHDVCSEICKLESALEVVGTDGEVTEKAEARSEALDFIHEMGWLLHRSHLKSRLGERDPNLDLFPFRRFRSLVEFSVEHDWCAVVKKLLDILFNGAVDAGGYPSIEFAVLEICLLHRAVRRNYRPMVEILLRCGPDRVLDKSGSEQKLHFDNLFKPDAAGPGGVTPLHLAASLDCSENVLDALTDDPGLVGVEAWMSCCDSTGLTPNDYACLRGHYSYIHLVQRKINKNLGSGHVALDIPASPLDCNIKVDEHKNSAKVSSFQTERTLTRLNQRCCKPCERKLAYRSGRTSPAAAFRPAMLSMVAVAAVCVCVALFFKSSPEVLYVFQPFRWELLEYGSS